jgi:hypothetical protein
MHIMITKYWNEAVKLNQLFTWWLVVWATVDQPYKALQFVQLCDGDEDKDKGGFAGWWLLSFRNPDLLGDSHPCGCPGVYTFCCPVVFDNGGFSCSHLCVCVFVRWAMATRRVLFSIQTCAADGWRRVKFDPNSCRGVRPIQEQAHEHEGQFDTWIQTSVLKSHTTAPSKGCKAATTLGRVQMPKMAPRIGRCCTVFMSEHCSSFVF